MGSPLMAGMLLIAVISKRCVANGCCANWPLSHVEKGLVALVPEIRGHKLTCRPQAGSRRRSI